MQRGLDSHPTIDYDEWKSWMSPARAAEAKKIMLRIKSKIAKSRTEFPAGQWSRAERKHGRLQAAFPTSPWARAVADGVKFQLKFMPHQVPIPPYPHKGKAKQVLDDCVRLWVKQRVAVPISSQKWQEFKRQERHLRFLPLFAVKKPGKSEYYEYKPDEVTNKWRPCMNAGSLNAALVVVYFKQANHVELDCLSEEGDLSSKTDIHSAFQVLYYSTDPVDVKRFGLTTTSDLMCFRSPDAFKASAPHGYQIIVNSFGTSNAPFFLQKPHKLVLSDLKSLGLRVGNVCDDNMLYSKAPRPPGVLLTNREWREASVFQCLSDTETMVDRYVYFGIPLSSKDVEESITPTRSKEMNGMLVCHDERKKYWTLRKVRSTMTHIEAVLTAHAQGRCIKARSLASLLGKLEAATQGLFGVHLFTDGLRADLIKALRLSTTGPSPVSRKQAYDRAVRTSQRTVDQLTYLHNDAFLSFNGRMMIHGSAVKYRLQTDWSSYGWGCWSQHSDGSVATISVPLDQAWRQMWSGAGETWTAVQAIIALAEAENWRSGVVSILMDNVAAVLYVNRMASRSQQINAILLHLLRFLKERNLMVIAGWIPGEIIEADPFSRTRTSIWDGELKQDLYSKLVTLLMTSRGISPPTMDLFATHLNRKTHSYGSLYPNPGAEWVDSMKHPWWPTPPALQRSYYAFPPPALLLPVILKALTEKQTVLLVLPVTQTTPFQQLARLLVTSPVVFPWTEDLVQNPQADMMTPVQRPYIQGNWMLASVVVSGSPSIRAKYRRKCSKLCSSKSWAPSQVWHTKSGPPSTHSVRLQRWLQSLRTSLKISL